MILQRPFFKTIRPKRIHFLTCTTGLCVGVVLLFLLPSLCCAQNLAFQQFTKNEGLIGNELTDVFIEPNGTVWISAYPTGVSVYDGKTFKSFPKNKFPHYSPGKIVSDKQGRISIVDYEQNGFGRVEGDSFKVYYVPDGGARVQLEKNTQQLYAINRKNTLFRFNENTKKFDFVSKIPFDTEGVGVGIHNFEYNTQTKNFEFIHHDKGIIQKWLWNNKELKSVFILKDTLHILLHAEKWGDVFITRNKQLHAFYLKNNQKFPILDPLLYKTPRFYSEDEQHYYFPTEPLAGVHEIYALSKKDLSVVGKYRFYHLSQVTSVKMDKAGTLWCATLYGLLRVFPQLLECKVGDPNMLGDLHTICEDKKGNIWFGTYGYGFCYFDGQKIQPSPPILRGVKNVLPGSITDDEGNMYFTTEQERTIVTDGFKTKKLWRDVVGFYFTKTNTGGIAFGQTDYKGLYIKEKDRRSYQIDSSKGLKLQNVITAVQDRQNRWWLGRGSQGVALYLPDKDTVLNWLRTADSGFGGMSSVIDDRGNLWFGTAQGLMFYSPPSMPADFHPFRDFTVIAKEVLGNQFISFLKIYKNRYLAIGSQDKGLYLLDLVHFYSGNAAQPRIFSFPLKKNLINTPTEQNSVWIDRQGYLWSGHDQGAVRVDWDSWAIDTLPPKVQIQRIEAGNATFFPKNLDYLSFSANENSLKIYLDRDLSPFLYDNVQFKYRLNAEDSFRLVQGDLIELSYLNPQKYKLEVIALKNGLTYPLPILTLDIKPYFWKTWWFWAIIAAIAFYIFYRFAEARQLVLQKDNDLKAKDLVLEKSEREKNQLQVQALVNQLNPHFINNALMWTQLRMINDEESVKVISKLNYNINTVFRNSLKGKSYHTLQEELNIVTNYLYIQNKRFEEAITCTLPTNDELNQLGNIPVFLMQIQIHCENAVEHGIRNSSHGKGALTIQILDKNIYLRIVIEDNGIGRKAAAALQSKGTQQGTKMLENLQRIFNKNNSLPLLFEYEDDIFKDDLGRNYGTRVIIDVPKNYKYELQ